MPGLPSSSCPPAPPLPPGPGPAAPAPPRTRAPTDHCKKPGGPPSWSLTLLPAGRPGRPGARTSALAAHRGLAALQAWRGKGGLQGQGSGPPPQGGPASTGQGPRAPPPEAAQLPCPAWLRALGRSAAGVGGARPASLRLAPAPTCPPAEVTPRVAGSPGARCPSARATGKGSRGAARVMLPRRRGGRARAGGP